eukprot:7027640-Pyramimonas_sp.AAC.1
MHHCIANARVDGLIFLHGVMLRVGLVRTCGARSGGNGGDGRPGSSAFTAVSGGTSWQGANPQRCITASPTRALTV